MPSGGNPMASILSTKPNEPVEKHKFWDTQPMPKFGQEVEREGPIEIQFVEDVQKEPCTLPPNFSW